MKKRIVYVDGNLLITEFSKMRIKRNKDKDKKYKATLPEIPDEICMQNLWNFLYQNKVDVLNIVYSKNKFKVDDYIKMGLQQLSIEIKILNYKEFSNITFTYDETVECDEFRIFIPTGIPDRNKFMSLNRFPNMKVNIFSKKTGIINSNTIMKMGWKEDELC